MGSLESTVRALKEARAARGAAESNSSFVFNLAFKIRKSEFFIDNFRDQVKRFRSTDCVVLG